MTALWRKRMNVVDRWCVSKTIRSKLSSKFDPLFTMDLPHTDVEGAWGTFDRKF
jgi:hypothetical protein